MPLRFVLTSNVIIITFKNITKALKYICNESFSQGIFSDKLKIARITPIFNFFYLKTIYALKNNLAFEQAIQPRTLRFIISLIELIML